MNTLSDEELLQALVQAGSGFIRACRERQADAGPVKDDPRWRNTPLPLRMEAQLHTLFLGVVDACDATTGLLAIRASQQAFGMIRFQAESVALIRWMTEPKDERERRKRAYRIANGQLRRWRGVLELDASKGPKEAHEAPKRVAALEKELAELAAEDGFSGRLREAPGRRYLFDKHLKEGGYEAFGMYSELGSHPGSAGNLVFALDEATGGHISFRLGRAFRQRAFWTGTSLMFLLLAAREVAVALGWEEWLKESISPLVKSAEPYLKEAAERKKRGREEASG